MADTILIVDDSTDTRLVARMVLESAGHEVEEAMDGEEALRRLLHEPLPDLILLDLRMPGIDGWEVLDRIRRNPHYHKARRLPIVLFSAHLDRGDPRASRATNVVTKPFRSEVLLERVATALAA